MFDVGCWVLAVFSHAMNALANLSSTRDDHRTLVVIFLRGAADGLTLVAPDRRRQLSQIPPTPSR
jgi:uncharacterized protein (DUF1501 family)